MKAKQTHSLVRILLTVLMVISMAGFLNVSSARANEITSLPKETTGPFLHNVFHDASDCGGECGGLLAWFDLDTESTNYYKWDTDNEFSLEVKIYDGANFSTSNQIGTATGTGNIDDTMIVDDSYTGASVGTITWNFSFETIDSLLKTHLVTNNALNNDIVMNFLDYNYVTSGTGFTANSWADPYLTLWGADGYNGAGEFNNGTLLGMDLVAFVGTGAAFSAPPVATPEPRSLLLLGSGLAGLGFLRRRNKEA